MILDFHNSSFSFTSESILQTGIFRPVLTWISFISYFLFSFHFCSSNFVNFRQISSAERVRQAKNGHAKNGAWPSVRLPDKGGDALLVTQRSKTQLNWDVNWVGRASFVLLFSIFKTEKYIQRNLRNIWKQIKLLKKINWNSFETLELSLYRIRTRREGK